MKTQSILKIAAAAACVFAFSTSTMAEEGATSIQIDTYGSCGVRYVKFNIDDAGALNAVCPGNSSITAYWGQNGCPAAGSSDAFRDALAVAVDYKDRVDLQFFTADNGNTCLYSVTKKL